MIIVEIIEQKVITPYRQVDDFSTYPYIYATLLSSDQILSLNNETGKYEIKTLSIVGHTHSEYALTTHTHLEYALTNHTHSWSDITYTPTTLLGYGIEDAYTKSEISDILSGITIDAYTKSEVDDIFNGTTLVTGYNKSNWDEAYSWGDPSGIYLPLTGGTLTGKLTGTEAEFTTKVKTPTLEVSTSIILNNRTLTIRTL